jgi:WD40 repeat protein
MSALRGSYRVPTFIFHATAKTFYGYGHILSTTATSSRLVTGDAAGLIAVWNLSSATPVMCTNQEHPVRAMCQLPYNKLATADGRRVRIWKSGGLQKTLEASAEVRKLAPLTFGRLAVATAHEVRIWDTIRARPLMTLNTCGALVAALPEGLASYCFEDNSVRVFDIESGERVARIDTGRAEDMVALPNGTLATVSDRLALWEIRTGRCLASKPLNALVMHQKLAATQQNRLVSNTRDSHFTVFHGRNLKTAELAAAREDPVVHLQAIPDGRIVTIDIANTVQVWG